MAVDPRGTDLKRFLQEDAEEPVVMLNLLRFQDAGQGAYEEYAHRIRPHLERAGAEVLYAGLGSTVLVANDGQDWDAVVLVRYPSRRAFSQMVADPDYQRITKLRTAALEEAVLQATTPWPL